MAELCLMASHGYLPGIVLQQEQAICKDCKPILQSSGTGQDFIKSGSRNLRPNQCEEPLKPITGFFDTNQFVKIDSIVRKPVLIDVQDTRADSVLFSFGIADQCTRNEQILQYLMCGFSEEERRGLDSSLLSDLMGLQAFSTDVHGHLFAPSLIYLNTESDPQNPLVDFVGDLARSSKIKVKPDGKVLFCESGTKMKDLLSVVAEFYVSKDLTKLRKHSYLVPYFDRLDSIEAQANNIQGSSLNLKALTVAPSKSPEKMKLKPSQKKKKCRTVGRERDLCKRNYFHACESLLSLMMNKRLRGKTAILSLKNSGPELNELLTQFSAGIAGTGLAVIFSIICKVACARAPFCTSKLLSTGFGFALVWLSWSVNRLGDTIVNISKNSSKYGLKEEEMVQQVDKSVKEIHFRAATLLAVTMLRLA